MTFFINTSYLIFQVLLLPPSELQRNYVLSVAVGGLVEKPTGREPMERGSNRTSPNRRNRVRDEIRPAYRHLQHFFRMFLFITFVLAECTGRVRVSSVCSRALPQAAQATECTIGAHSPPPSPAPHFSLIHIHTVRQTILGTTTTLTVTTSLRLTVWFAFC